MNPRDEISARGAIVAMHADDNIVVAARNLIAGEKIVIHGDTITVIDDVSIGHKLACRPILSGEKISRYGAPIGSALRDIVPGEHVHMHNMTSDYIASHLRGDVESQDAEDS